MNQINRENNRSKAMRIFKKAHLSLLLAGSMVLLAGCMRTDVPTQDVNQQQEVQNQQPGSNQNNADKGQNTQSSADETVNDDIDLKGTAVSGNTVSLTRDQGVVLINQGGTYTISGTGSTIVVDAKDQNVTLKLNNVIMSSEDLPNLYIRNAKKVTVELSGTSTLGNTGSAAHEDLDAAVYSRADLEVKGSGTLKISTKWGAGIKTTASAVFQSGIANIDSAGNGIRAGSALSFAGGTYTIKAGSEGIESKDSLTINGGKFDVDAQDDALNATNSIVINDGSLIVRSSGNDAIDSNGDLIINGGEVTAIGSMAPEGAFDTDNTPFEINGGKVIGLGGSLLEPSSVKQPVILTSLTDASSEKTEIQVKENDKVVVSFSLDSAAQTGGMLLISDAALQKGHTYEIFANGTSLGEVEIQNDIQSMGNISQSFGGRGDHRGPGGI